METEDWTDGEINLKAEKSQDLNKEEGPEEEMFECMAITTIQDKLLKIAKIKGETFYL